MSRYFKISLCPIIFLLILDSWAKKSTHHHHKLLRHVDVEESHKHGFTPAPDSVKPHKDVCVGEDECVLPVQCPAHFYSSDNTECKVSGRKGVCCHTGHNHTAEINHRGRGHGLVIKGIDKHVLRSISREGRMELEDFFSKEEEILSSGKAARLSMGSPSYGHFRNTRVFSADLHEVMNIANRALEIALATKAFKEKQGITNQQLEWSLVQQNLRPTPLGSACAPILDCPPIPERHRRIDGSCNNLLNPSWGTPMSAFSRLLPPSYYDGIWLPRVSEDKGQPLLSPRLISTAIIDDGDAPDPEFTMMVMQFGQFLAHEITQAIDTTFANGSAISCCTQDGMHQLPPHLRHFACMPVHVPHKDPFYSHFRQGCMNFVRSILAPRTDCTLGYGQQMNRVTHFIDGSTIYGSSPQQTTDMRSFERGQLRVFNDFGREFLPLTKEPESCLTMEQGSACFESGDTRTNQMITLVVLHTIFMREHNRVCHELSKINPHWTDERLFLEARRIVTAELQVVTYKEYLPAILGDGAMREFDIALDSRYDYSYDYNQRVEPSVTNEFSTAAYRFGHSMVNGLLKVYGRHRVEEMIFIPEVMFFPGRLRRKPFFDEVLSTLATEPIQTVDTYLSEALTKYMFRAGHPFGVDLAALNIQRGRDHGLRPYNDYRQLVGLPRHKSFEDFGPEFGPKLEQVYASVDDVDLWIGGLLEPKHPGSIMGTTFRDIIADQFVRLKKGDRYFFDHDPTVNPGYFTLEQLMELKKGSMARLVCDNSDQFLLAKLSPNIFRQPSHANQLTECSGDGIQRVNLKYWKDFVNPLG